MKNKTLNTSPVSRETQEKKDVSIPVGGSSSNIDKDKLILRIRNHKSIRDISKLLMESLLSPNPKYSPATIRAFEKLSKIYLIAYRIEDEKRQVRRERKRNKELGID